jgi:aromatic-L-amino-acid decarboxylase
MGRNAELSLSDEQMRSLGYAVVDLLVDHFSNLAQKSVTRKASRSELEARLRKPLPVHGEDPLRVLDTVQRDVLGNIMHMDHPRYFAFIPGPSNFVGAMGDALASGFNVLAANWLEASGAGQIELLTIDWLREACGFPESAGGLFVSGGSMANLTALAVARRLRLADDASGALVYFSDQTHYSIEKGLHVLGFQPSQIRGILSDDDFRLSVPRLRAAIEADRAAGGRPFCVVANAGTTSTGAVDPLLELGSLCAAENLWLHVDGAYGAGAALSERARKELQGLESAHSVCLDPHKWLFQPYECGCVLVREDRWLRETFTYLPEYLGDIDAREGEVHYCQRGIQLSRGFRALKLWMSLKIFGLQSFQAAIDRGFALAEFAQEVIESMAGWEVVTPAQMAILTFRYAPPDRGESELDQINRELVEGMIAEGFAMLSSTRLRGRRALRMCTINPRTSEGDIRDTLGLLSELAARLN